jgi:hypothetical protein
MLPPLRLSQADIAFVSICRSLYESGSVLPDEAHGLVELMHSRDPRILAARDVRPRCSDCVGLFLV